MLNSKQRREPPTTWGLFNERYPIIESLVAYGSKRCDNFTIDNERAVLFVLMDFINTDDGRNVVTTWYGEVSHTIALVQQVATNANHCDQRLASSALNALNVEIDRVTARLIAAWHST